MPDLITKKSLKINVSKSIGEVSAIYCSPPKAEYVTVFAHGAGAGMENKSMEAISVSLAGQGIATLRFNFPYMENGRKMPDTKPVCTSVIKAAVDKAAELCPKLPIFAAGKSFGGRMTSTAASMGLLDNVKGIIFFGFPLHPPGKPSTERAEHLFSVNIPMLFLQGTRDTLAALDLLKPIVEKLKDKDSEGQPGLRRTELFIIEGADHSFHCTKEYKLKDSEVIELLSREVKRWMDEG